MTTTQTAASRPRFALLSAFVMLFALMTVSAPANAQVQFNLLTSYLGGNRGDTLSYFGTLTNLGSEEVFLNGDLFNLPGDDLTVDDSPFFTNFPLSLGAGESFTDAMFTVNIGPNTPQGTYQGTFTILGGPSDGDFNPLATQTFGVSVGAPEPGTGWLLFVGATAFTGATLRSRVKATRRNV